MGGWQKTDGCSSLAMQQCPTSHISSTMARLRGGHGWIQSVVEMSAAEPIHAALTVGEELSISPAPISRATANSTHIHIDFPTLLRSSSSSISSRALSECAKPPHTLAPVWFHSEDGGIDSLPVSPCLPGLLVSRPVRQVRLSDFPRHLNFSLSVFTHWPGSNPSSEWTGTLDGTLHLPASFRNARRTRGLGPSPASALRRDYHAHTHSLSLSLGVDAHIIGQPRVGVVAAW